jgi:Major Facilitator Superfamily
MPERHLAKALGLWEAGIAGAIAIAPVIATAIIDSVGVSAGFMLSGAALIVIGAAAALALTCTRGRASSRTSTSSRTGPSEAVTSASAAG